MCIVKFVVQLFLFLFKRFIGILVRIIEGYGKDDINIEEVVFDLQFLEINYVWNVVYIGDEWCFVDCMWDVGYIDDIGKF